MEQRSKEHSPGLTDQTSVEQNSKTINDPPSEMESAPEVSEPIPEQENEAEANPITDDVYIETDNAQVENEATNVENNADMNTENEVDMSDRPDVPVLRKPSSRAEKFSQFLKDKGIVKPTRAYKKAKVQKAKVIFSSGESSKRDLIISEPASEKDEANLKKDSEMAESSPETTSIKQGEKDTLIIEDEIEGPPAIKLSSVPTKVVKTKQARKGTKRLKKAEEVNKSPEPSEMREKNETQILKSAQYRNKVNDSSSSAASDIEDEIPFDNSTPIPSDKEDMEEDDIFPGNSSNFQSSKNMIDSKFLQNSAKQQHFIVKEYGRPDNDLRKSKEKRVALSADPIAQTPHSAAVLHESNDNQNDNIVVRCSFGEKETSNKSNSKTVTKRKLAREADVTRNDMQKKQKERIKKIHRPPSFIPKRPFQQLKKRPIAIKNDISGSGLSSSDVTLNSEGSEIEVENDDSLPTYEEHIRDRQRMDKNDSLKSYEYYERENQEVETKRGKKRLPDLSLQRESKSKHGARSIPSSVRRKANLSTASKSDWSSLKIPKEYQAQGVTEAIKKVHDKRSKKAGLTGKPAPCASAKNTISKDM